MNQNLYNNIHNYFEGHILKFNTVIINLNILAVLYKIFGFDMIKTKTNIFFTIIYIVTAWLILCTYSYIMMTFDNLKLDEFRCVIDELQEIKIVKRLQDAT